MSTDKSKKNLVGQIISGYEIAEMVGEGGMGAVYRARQISLEREVAFKVLALRYSADEEFVARFRREAKSIAKINHPNILQVYDVGDVNGLYFIAMEFVEGENLIELLSAHGFVEWRQCTEYIRQAAMGLAAAAKANVVHRDIKPDNLMVTHDGIIKVSDFGLAKEVTSAQLTQTGETMGTPAYMSPEQCDGGALDTRTDMYSLGGTFYRALTGVLPFNAPTPMALMYKHKYEPLVPPRQYMPNIPQVVEDAVIRMMAKDPADRYANMQEIVDVLGAALNEPLVEVTGEMTQKMDPLDSSIIPLSEVTTPVASPLPPVSVPAAPSAPVAPPPAAKALNLAPLAPTSPPPPPAALASAFVPGEGELAAPVAATNPRGKSSQTLSGVDFDAIVEKGNQLMRDGRPLAASECWSRALEIRPGDKDLIARIKNSKKDSTVAGIKIGESLLAQAKAGTVRMELQQILHDDPNNVDAREKIAALDFMEQRKREAIMRIRKLLSSNQHEDALAMWEKVHPALRDANMAQTMNHLKDHVLPAKELARQGEKLNELGRFDDALEVWEQAADLDPANDRVKLGREESQRLKDRLEHQIREGYEHQMQQKYDAAIACFEQALALSPKHTRTLRYLADSLLEVAHAAETANDIDGEIRPWKELKKRGLEVENAEARLGELEATRSRLQATIDTAREAQKRGAYGRSIAQWEKVLVIQPTNKAAAFGLSEARSSRLKKRILPLFGIAVLSIVGILVSLHYTYNNKVYWGDKEFSEAKNIVDFNEAIAQWKNAKLVFPFGTLNLAALNKKIAKAKLRSFLTEESLYYQEKNLDALQSFLREAIPKLKDADALLAAGERDKIIFTARLHIAHLLFLAGKLEQSASAFRDAKQFGKGQGIPAELDKIRTALRYFEKAQEVQDNQQLPLATRNNRAIVEYKNALEAYPKFVTAQVRLARLQKNQTSNRVFLENALAALKTGRKKAGAGRFAAAELDFKRAAAAAEKILEQQKHNWDARKIKAEAQWRKEAGEGMVFFLYQPENDEEASLTFRAFALDRYEWPNQKGVMPLRKVSFVKAKELAYSVNKLLPTLAEWRFAASQGVLGITHRKYSYGDQYDPQKGNTESSLPWKSGSREKARTPQGVYDLTGNVAEWVIDTKRKATSSQQILLGGHYASGAKGSVNRGLAGLISDNVKATNSKYGFRAARRWQIWANN